MREIKFRAWDKELKLMLEPVDLSQPLQYYKWLGRGDRPIMQYTGLKDKNGVEVYEGDIVKCSMGCPHEIIWTDGFSGMPMFYLNGLMPGYSWTDDEEVVGNIYQNPELIK